MQHKTVIRAFDGSLADAEGLLAVEKATFDEAPYSAEQVQAMLTGGAQRAWLATGGGQVVGFIVAFLTHGLGDPRWEIDLLAVHPDCTGRGLAARLIRKAAAGGMRLARRARAVVATDNVASARAFLRAGFRRAGLCELLICRLEDQAPRPWVALGVTVREAANIEEVAGWLPKDAVHGAVDESEVGQERRGLTLLVAEYHGHPTGYAELIEVQTLLYRGLWIESLSASAPLAGAEQVNAAMCRGALVRGALIHEAVNRASAAGLDEIGMLVPERDQAMRKDLRSAGFRSLGAFDWLAAVLPLPGLAASDAGDADV
jgi:ribosomal protein S18 acetylase RimI-like enzyme